jgi:L-iditol 2-dehydrogenase
MKRGEVRLEARELAPRDGEVIVAVKRAGICRTDVYVADGALAVEEPRVLGHEAAGMVNGVRVVIEPALSCVMLSRAPCAACVAGRPCAFPIMLGVDRDGAFAEHVCVPVRAVHRVPDALSWEAAAMVEPVAAAVGVLRAPIDRSAPGAVLGRGRIATLLTRVLAAAGISHELLDTSDIGHANECSFAWVVEARATTATLDAAMRALRPGGVLVLKSRPPSAVPFDVALAVRKEIAVAPRSYAPFDEALGWLASGRIVVDDLVGEIFPIEKFETAFTAARASEGRKVFFAIGG